MSQQWKLRIILRNKSRIDLRFQLKNRKLQCEFVSTEGKNSNYIGAAVSNHIELKITNAIAAASAGTSSLLTVAQ